MQRPHHAGPGPLHLRRDRTGSGEITVREIRLKDNQNRECFSITPGEPLHIELVCSNTSRRHYPDLIADLTICSNLGNPLMNFSSWLTAARLGSDLTSDGVLSCKIESVPLVPGLYQINCLLTSQAKGAKVLDCGRKSRRT